MIATRRSFGTKEDLAVALAEAVAEHLNDGIEARGHAVLAVSGGSTPGRFFQVLGRRKDIDWSRVTVTLVDERWVPETSSRSNAGLVNEKLLQGPAASAHFVPLYAGGDEPDDAGIARTNAAIDALPTPFDAVILGMGNDGHTASFFPGGDTLAEALTGEGPAMAIRAPGAGEPRVTLVLGRLLDAAGLYLHIEGEEKLATLEKAAGDGPVEDMPIRSVLRQSQTPLTIFWSP
ncbi:6-phosphogluconolactonase [Devosia sp. ZB163]|uniref:6-phosphogluconolactonase n=1 Tax=Devosia sp. ZB163 TaxID=3025938 RepID=UPI0023612F19|nr:6-phosphogluconolactonase [Devosia sp. ZB163]MDC9823163.1 6-phosphogluconolactonase [Devosia sp. ZB163]